MKSVNEVITDVIARYPENTLDYDIVQSEDNIWVVNVYNKQAPGSLLQFEVIYNEVPTCCVLKKVNVGRRSMFKFMNRVMDSFSESTFEESENRSPT